MIGYDNFIAYNYRDDELGSIQDDEPIEEEEEMDEDAFAKAIENMEECRREMTALEDRLEDISDRLAVTTTKLRNAITEATAHLNQEIPYRDAKFNEGVGR